MRSRMYQRVGFVFGVGLFAIAVLESGESWALYSIKECGTKQTQKKNLSKKLKAKKKAGYKRLKKQAQRACKNFAKGKKRSFIKFTWKKVSVSKKKKGKRLFKISYKCMYYAFKKGSCVRKQTMTATMPAMNKASAALLNANKKLASCDKNPKGKKCKEGAEKFLRTDFISGVKKEKEFKALNKTCRAYGGKLKLTVEVLKVVVKKKASKGSKVQSGTWQQTGDLEISYKSRGECRF